MLDTLYSVAEEAGKTPAQAAINWLLNSRGVTAPIIGARTLDQLEANLGSAGWALTEDQLERLTKASELFVSYPYDIDAKNQRTKGRE